MYPLVDLNIYWWKIHWIQSFDSPWKDYIFEHNKLQIALIISLIKSTKSCFVFPRAMCWLLLVNIPFMRLAGVGESVKIGPRFSRRVQIDLSTSLLPRWTSFRPSLVALGCQRGLPRSTRLCRGKRGTFTLTWLFDTFTAP